MKKPGTSTNNIENIRESILDKLIIVISIFGLIPLTISLYRAVEIGFQNVMYFQITGYLIIGCTAIYHKGLPYTFKALIVILMAFLCGSIAIVNMGMVGSGILFLFSTVLYSTIFFSVRVGMTFILASVFILARNDPSPSASM